MAINLFVLIIFFVLLIVCYKFTDFFIFGQRRFNFICSKFAECLYFKHILVTMS